MSRMKQQIAFDDPRLKKVKAFGGTLMRKAKHRTSRPVSTKSPMHLVLKSSQAKGSWSFLHKENQKILRLLIAQQCRKYGVKLLQYANGGNHLHLLVKFPSRQVYLRFIRSMTCAIAMKVTKVNKFSYDNKQLSKKLKFWDYRPFSTVVDNFRQLNIVKDYINLNILESLGILKYQEARLATVDKRILEIMRI